MQKMQVRNTTYMNTYSQNSKNMKNLYHDPETLRNVCIC